MSRALDIAREARDRARGERDYQERESKRLSEWLFRAIDENVVAKHG